MISVLAFWKGPEGRESRAFRLSRVPCIGEKLRLGQQRTLEVKDVIHWHHPQGPPGDEMTPQNEAYLECLLAND